MAKLPIPMPADDHLQPAQRDPKKLRRTAIWLVLVIVLGGPLVMVSYDKWTLSEANDNRPSIVYRILPDRSLRMVRQDGKQADLMDLRDKVFAIDVVDTDQLEDSARSLAVLKRLSKRYAHENDFRIVTLILNPGPPEGLIEKLKAFADVEGIHLPQWWVGSNKPSTLRKFIRQELKPSVVPEKVNGHWEFDSSIVLVDRNGHLRRAVVPQKRGGPPYIAVFDFDQAAKWDAEGKKTGTKLTNQQQLERLLVQTINQLLAEPYQPS